MYANLTGMARVRVDGWLFAIAPALLLAGVCCEFVMDDLPTPRAPVVNLDAAADEIGSEPDVLDDSAVEQDPPEGEPEASGCATPCDCDNDMHPEVGSCGGDDCDDNDDKVWANEPTYYDVESLHRQFDYDCSNSYDPDPAWNKQIECAGLAIAMCDDTHQGYLGTPPACGQPGQWAKCVKNNLICEPQVLYGSKKLPCK